MPRERTSVQFPGQRTAGCPAVPLALWQGAGRLMVVRTDDEVGMGETTKIKPGIPLPLGYSIQPGEPVESVSGYSNARQRFTKELVTLHQTFSLPSLKQEKKKTFFRYPLLPALALWGVKQLVKVKTRCIFPDNKDRSRKIQ